MPKFKFPQSIFSAHDLRYVDKPPADLRDNEACWHKEDQHENGEWMSYRLSLRRDGTVHSTKVSRHDFLSNVAAGNGDTYMKDLVTWLCNAN